MRLFRSKTGVLLEEDGQCVLLESTSWDGLLNMDDLASFLRGEFSRLSREATSPLPERELLPPIGRQEVWAAGVTYFKSRDARMEESKEAGGDSCYDRVYNADRPELFFKATPHRVVGHLQRVRVRRDSNWTVPEPELTLAITSTGKIIGYTIGNDMSSRDIEGANPLYLPQAKVYSNSCGLGPGILVQADPLPEQCRIRMSILRDRVEVFSGKATLGQMKRRPEELVQFLFRENSFPHGCFLLTGTGIVPPGRFSLRAGDEIRITIDSIGCLINTVM